jgi:hypothetical protein
MLIKELDDRVNRIGKALGQLRERRLPNNDQ